MTYAQVEKFEKTVFGIELPLLTRYLVFNEALKPDHDKYIMRELQDYVKRRKRDNDANRPKPAGSTLF